MDEEIVGNISKTTKSFAKRVFSELIDQDDLDYVDMLVSLARNGSLNPSAIKTIHSYFRTINELHLVFPMSKVSGYSQEHYGLVISRRS